MKLTAITCTTPARSEAFALCKRYMERQTRQPDQWLVMDGPEPMPSKILSALPSVQGDYVAFFEDDDWYSPLWLEWAVKQAEHGFDLIGEGNAIFYNVAMRWMSEMGNTRHASLCQTVMSMSMAEQLVNTIQAWDNWWFDCRLWRLNGNKLLHLPNGHRLAIGIKGIGGNGYSSEHREAFPDGSQVDPSLFELWSLIGDDAQHYEKFYSLTS